MFMCELRIRLTEEGGSVGIVKGAVRPGIGRASDFSGTSTSAMIVIVKADSNVFGAPIEGGSSAIVGTACGVCTCLNSKLGMCTRFVLSKPPDFLL